MSVVIPARTWDRYLEATLASLDAQTLPPGVDVEVVVAVAEPSTGTAPATGVTVVANERGTIPTGLNRAIAASSGEIVARVDARCVLQPDHITRVMAGLEDLQVGCAGGAALVLDRGLFGSTYAIAFNSMLLGPTVYRYRRSSGPVDAAYLGAWRRADLDRLGGFDEQLLRNQDNELADRVRASGQTVWYDAGLVIGYHNARDLRGALAHHHEFGLWRMMQRSQGQRALTSRHVGALGAAAAVGLAGAGALASPRTRPWLAGAAAAVYAAAGAVAWRSASRLRAARPDIAGARLHPLAPVLAPALGVALDGAWLVGLLQGSNGRKPSGVPAAHAPSASRNVSASTWA